MDDFWKEKKVKKTVNIKLVIVSIIIVAVIAGIITTIILYINNTDFRGWIDKYILKKEITEADTVIIDLRRR